ncbi:putative enoyl reductase, partial [Lachnellula occidentalis]
SSLANKPPPVPNKPVKKLPTSIEITDKTTLQDVKEQLAKPGHWDPERLGIYDSSKKLLKDRRAILSQQESVMADQELLVKDLGPQLSWTTVFVIEYLGPILIHLAVPLLLRPYIYRTSAPLSSSQYLSMAMIAAHFLKREYETLFVHRFSLATMPFFNIFKNCGHYWVLSGFNLAYWVYAPTSYTAQSSPTIDKLNIVGIVLYLFGEISNAHTHVTLSKLRSKGETERKIPKGYGFGMVTCPNYFFELIAWTGVLCVTRSWATVLFIGVAWGQMHLWAVGKEKALRKQFPDTYKKKKHVIVPFVG